jgi:tetratricopeptide (TPR) repeat protein
MLNRVADLRWLVIVLILVLLLTGRLYFASMVNFVSLELLKPWVEYHTTSAIPICKVLGDYSRVEQVLYSVSRLSDSSTVLVQHGQLYWLQGRCDEATAAWSAVLSHEIEHPAAAQGLLWAGASVPGTLEGPLAQFAYSQGTLAVNDEVAQEWYERSLELDPNLPAATTLARFHHERGNLREEEAVWQYLVANIPEKSADYWWALAQLAELDDDWRSAAESYHAGATVSDSPYEFFIQEGLSWQRADNWQRAKHSFLRALLLRPDIVGSYLNLGHLYRARGDFSSALSWYSFAQARFPMEGSPAHYMGVIYLMEGNHVAAQFFLMRAQALSPDNPWSSYFLAQSLYETGQERKAFVYLVQAIRLHEAPPRQWLLERDKWATTLNNGSPYAR